MEWRINMREDILARINKINEELAELDIDMEQFGFDTETFDIEDNEYEEQELKENKTQLHKCPECGCEFED